MSVIARIRGLFGDRRPAKPPRRVEASATSRRNDGGDAGYPLYLHTGSGAPDRSGNDHVSQSGHSHASTHHHGGEHGHSHGDSGGWGGGGDSGGGDGGGGGD